MARALLAIVLFALALGPTPAPAQDATPGEVVGPFRITADSVEYDRARALYVAEGDVVITDAEGRRLTADWVSFSNRTRKGVASGDVVVVDGGDTLRADFLQFDVDDFTGVVYRGELESEQSGYVLEGREVEKTGPATYVFHEGAFTTCRCPDESDREPWKIRAERAKIELDGSATARNSTLEILGVPVFWVPWFTYPLRTTRKTGFLLPRFNAAQGDRTDIGVPFFWAALPELNVLLTPSWIPGRGVKGEVDFEYVIGERSGGLFHAAYLHDGSVDPDQRETPFSPDRWAVRFRHDQFLPDLWRAKLDLALLSDNSWPNDFDDLRGLRADRFAESVLFAGRPFGPLGRFAVGGGIWYADDLQSPDSTDRDAFLLQRLPHLTLSGRTEPLEFARAFTRSFEGELTWFASREHATSELPLAVQVGGAFLDTGIDALPDGREVVAGSGDEVRLDGTLELEDGTILSPAQQMARGLSVVVDASADDAPGGPEGDGRFQPGEPLSDRGGKLLLTPRLGRPLHLAGGRLELFPEVGLHQTFYQTRNQDFRNRTLLAARLDARTRLERALELPFGGGGATHVVEPGITWIFLDGTDQEDLPLFQPAAFHPQERLRGLSLHNILADPADRAEEWNGFRLQVANRIYRTSDDGVPAPVADFTVASLVNLHHPGDRGGFYLDGEFWPLGNLHSRLVFGYDYEDTRVSEGLASLAWSSPAGHDLSLRYRFLREIPPFFEAFRFDRDRFRRFEEGFEKVDQIELFARWAFLPRWGATWNSTYSLEESIFLDNRVGLEYVSACACWAVRVELEEDRSRGLSLGFQYRVFGLGEDRTRPFQGGGRSRRVLGGG